MLLDLDIIKCHVWHHEQYSTEAIDATETIEATEATEAIDATEVPEYLVERFLSENTLDKGSLKYSLEYLSATQWPYIPRVYI